jgi:hypothetical protein
LNVRFYENSNERTSCKREIHFEYRWSDGTRETLNQQMILLPLMKWECQSTHIYRLGQIEKAYSPVDFVSDRMLHNIQRGHWTDIIFLNVCAPTEVRWNVGYHLKNPHKYLKAAEGTMNQSYILTYSVDS